MSSLFVFANILQPLIDVFEWVLLRIYDVLGSWGWSIIGLTIIVRAALVPLTLKQFRSMRKLQALAPQIKEVQEKYKDDKQRQQQEMMRFYQENQVNPLSSCLPLVAQFPVFISLFYMLRKDLKLDICPGITQYVVEHNTTIAKTSCDTVDPGSGQFLFIPDLTNKATGAVLVVLIVLYVGSQVVSTLLMSVTADKTQRRLFLVLPLVFVAFIINFPAGLLVYWITTNLWTIAQGYIVRRQAPPLPAAATAGAGGGGSGGGSFLERLTGGMAGGGAAAATDGKKTGSKSGDTKTKAKPKPAASSGANGKSGGKSKSDGDGEGDGGTPKAKPPPPPRKKRKQRSGRRR